MYKEEIVLLLRRVLQTIQTIEQRNQSIHSVQDYLLTENGMEKLDAACMLIQTIGENIKTIDERSKGKLLAQYPEIPWKRVIRMRDYISHHYDGVDADVVFETIKNNLPPLFDTVKRILADIQ
ncbi:HepT-like ribonuclease domain-containing protein [Parabacteroides leei]|uniref:HepT-like ribonuclease domain-containing protein n=2 Tax=Parabacteroides leei TaxID=2939491 RepID=UPI00189C545E|nr:HepT-like ribonuclease domain-containing protein [uncultured Parabacteroides sp.]